MENDESNSNSNLLFAKRMRSAFNIQQIVKRIESKMTYNCSGKNSDFFEMAVRFF